MATTLYEGVKKLAQNVMEGRNPEVPVTDGNFRYPGEVLERMEERGYSSLEDYCEVMRAILDIKYEMKYPDEKMYVGNQVTEFLSRAEKKAKKYHNLMLLYHVILYRQDTDLQPLYDIAKCNTIKDVVEFLYKALISSTKREDYLTMANQIFTEKKDIWKLTACPIMENKEFFRTFIKLCSKLTDCYKASELLEFVPIYASLYKEHVKGRKRKKMMDIGFTEAGVLQLNFGIWYVSGISTDLSYDSTIKWWRLKKEWFQAMLTQPEELQCSELLEEALTDEMPQKINGTKNTYRFLFDGFTEKVTNIQNSYHLFYLLTTDAAKSARVDPYVYYQNICPKYPITLDNDKDIAWIKGLVEYLSDKVTVSRSWKIMQILIEQYMTDVAALKEKSVLIEEFFKKDVKKLILHNVTRFNADKIKYLIDQDYLTIDELYVSHKHWLEIYISEFEKEEKISFLMKYCEDRNWQFTEEEVSFLESCLKSSWPVSLAYYNKDMPIHTFEPETFKCLLGLVCEICTRIPSICDLNHLMAGYISHRETRDVLGEDLCNRWYEALVKRDYIGIKTLQEEYLSEEKLKQIKDKEKQLEELEKEKEIQEAEKEILGKYQSLSELSKNLPYPWRDSVQAKGVLRAFEEHFTDTYILKKKECEEIYEFCVECYKHDLLTQNLLLNLFHRITEEKS